MATSTDNMTARLSATALSLPHLPQPLLDLILQALPLADKLTAVACVSHSLHSRLQPSSFTHDVLWLADTSLKQLSSPEDRLSKSRTTRALLAGVGAASINCTWNAKNGTLLSQTEWSALRALMGSSSSDAAHRPLAGLTVLSITWPDHTCIEAVSSCTPHSSSSSSSTFSRFPHLRCLRLDTNQWQNMPASGLSYLPIPATLQHLTLSTYITGEALSRVLSLPLRHLYLDCIVAVNDTSCALDIHPACSALQLPRVILQPQGRGLDSYFLPMLQRYRSTQHTVEPSLALQQRCDVDDPSGVYRPGLQSLLLSRGMCSASVSEAASIASLTHLDASDVIASTGRALMHALCAARLPHLSAVQFPPIHELAPLSATFFDAYHQQLRSIDVCWPLPKSTLPLLHTLRLSNCPLSATAIDEALAATPALEDCSLTHVVTSAEVLPLIGRRCRLLRRLSICLSIQPNRSARLFDEAARDALQRSSADISDTPSSSSSTQTASRAHANNLFPHLRILHVVETGFRFHRIHTSPPGSLLHLVRLLRHSPLLLLDVSVIVDPLSELATMRAALPQLRVLHLTYEQKVVVGWRREEWYTARQRGTPIYAKLSSIMQPFCYRRPAVDTDRAVTEARTARWMNEVRDRDRDTGEMRSDTALTDSRMMAAESAAPWITERVFDGRDGKHAFFDRIAELAAARDEYLRTHGPAAACAPVAVVSAPLRRSKRLRGEADVDSAEDV